MSTRGISAAVVGDSKQPDSEAISLKWLMVISSLERNAAVVGDSKQPDSTSCGKFYFVLAIAKLLLTLQMSGDSDFLGIPDSLIMKVDGVCDR